MASLLLPGGVQLKVGVQFEGAMLLRKRVPEIMDDPDLDQGLHHMALRGLARLNAMSNSRQILARPIEKLARSRGPGQTLKVLDLACGAGDLPIELSKYFRRSGLKVEIQGMDLSETALQHARSQDTESGCQFGCLDVVADDLPEGFDVIIVSLFTHHLDPPEIEALLAKMARRARHMVLVNDLERSYLSLLGVTLATRILTQSRVVWHDGPASVRAAFTADEMLKMAQNAGLAAAQVQRQWPCRILLTWTKDAHAV